MHNSPSFIGPHNSIERECYFRWMESRTFKGLPRIFRKSAYNFIILNSFPGQDSYRKFKEGAGGAQMVSL